MAAQFDLIESSIQRELQAMCVDATWKFDRTLCIKKAIWRAMDPRYRFDATIPGERAEWMWDAIAWEPQPGGRDGRLVSRTVSGRAEAYGGEGGI